MSGPKSIDALSVALEVLQVPKNVEVLKVKLQESFTNDPLAFFDRYRDKRKPVAPPADERPPVLGVNITLTEKKRRPRKKKPKVKGA